MSKENNAKVRLERNEKNHSKHQILILAEQNGGDCGKIMKKATINNFDINCQFKPFAIFEDIVSEYNVLTKNFNKSDYVIIFVGANNAIKGKQISEKCLSDLLNYSKKTNLILVSAPYFNNRPVLNNLIFNENLKLYTFIRNINDSALFIDTNFILKNHCHDVKGVLKYCDKISIINYIANNAINRKNALISGVNVRKASENHNSGPVTSNQTGDKSKSTWTQETPLESMSTINCQHVREDTLQGDSGSNNSASQTIGNFVAESNGYCFKASENANKREKNFFRE